MTETLSVVVERALDFPPEKVWRALTQSHLIEAWLMQNDFQPIVDHRFNFRGDWGVVEGQVLLAEPGKALSYSWTAFGQKTIVSYTLTPTDSGTLLRVEQAGFPADQEHARFYQGAQYGWQKFLGTLEQVLARVD